MMIKEAVNSPRLQGEMNHSKHHYRLFWSNINSATQRSFDNVGLEIFADWWLFWTRRQRPETRVHVVMLESSGGAGTVLRNKAWRDSDQTKTPRLKLFEAVAWRTSPDPGTRVSSPVPACIIITDQQPLACKHLLMLTRHSPDLDKEDFMVTTSNTGFQLSNAKIMRLILMLAWDYFWREFVEEVARELPGATQNIFLLIIL